MDMRASLASSAALYCCSGFNFTSKGPVACFVIVVPLLSGYGEVALLYDGFYQPDSGIGVAPSARKTAVERINPQQLLLDCHFCNTGSDLTSPFVSGQICFAVSIAISFEKCSVHILFYLQQASLRQDYPNENHR